MSNDKMLSDFHRRLDDLEKRLAEKEAEIGRTGSVPHHHRKQIDEISTRASAMRKKVQGAEQSTWDIVKHDLEADWSSLTHSFGHWIEHVDEEYRNHES